MALFREPWAQPNNLSFGERWRKDEMVDVHYQLEVEGLVAGYFLSMEGGDMDIAMIKHDVVYETGDSSTLLIPGPTTFHPINLQKGFGDYAVLYNWFAAASSGDINYARRNGSITMNKKVSSGGTSAYEAVIRWDFANAWLQKLSGFRYNQFQAALTAQLRLWIVPESIEMVQV